MKQYVMILDLKDDPELIEAYIDQHQRVWPEVIQSITDSGILNMQLFQAGDRLVMLMDTADDFSFERKSQMDAQNPKVKEWEAEMDRYQKRLGFAPKEEKWVLAEKIFELNK